MTWPAWKRHPQADSELRVLAWEAEGRCQLCQQSPFMPAAVTCEYVSVAGQPIRACLDCLRAANGEPGFVYFIRAGDLVKIGYSKSPEHRLRDLTVGSPLRLELWRKQPGSPQSERALHARFKDSREHGEWFRVTDRITEYVEAA